MSDDTLCIDKPAPIAGKYHIEAQVPAPDCALESWGGMVSGLTLDDGRAYPVLYTEREHGPCGDGRCYLLLDEQSGEAVLCLSPGFGPLVEVERMPPESVSMGVVDAALDAMCWGVGPALDAVKVAMGRWARRMGGEDE